MANENNFTNVKNRMQRTSEPIVGNNGFSDRRVRLSAKPAAKELVYGPREPWNILNPLWSTGGLLFPYTPYINDMAAVNYEHFDPVHTNQPFAAFKNVAPKDIQIAGPFTAMNQDEATYCLAAIHFLRTVTKMYFGVGSEGVDKNFQDNSAESVRLRGTPPPILLLNGYGTAIYHNVPVVVTNYTVELPQDVDYVRVDTSAYGKAVTDANSDTLQIVSRDISAWVPTKFNIAVTVQVQNTPDRMRRHFNLNDFRTGRLVKRGGWV